MLHEIVNKLGGDIYAGGRKANIPGPNHSRRDRSVSILLNAAGKVIVNSHVGENWRDIMRMLHDANLIDAHGKPIVNGTAPSSSVAVTTDADKQAAVDRIWSIGTPVPGSLSERYLRQERCIMGDLPQGAMAHCAKIPVSAYDANARYFRPGLILKIVDQRGRLCGLQLHYLASNGGLDVGLKVPRKTIGNYTPGWHVRLDADEEEMVIGTGFFSTLSARRYFGLPAVALLADKNLKHWRPGRNTRKVIIAADNDSGGLAAAAEAQEVLRSLDIRVSIEVAPNGLNDFNDYDKQRARGDAMFLN